MSSSGPCKVLLCTQKATLAPDVLPGEKGKKFLRDLQHPGWISEIQGREFGDPVTFNAYIDAVDGAPMTEADVAVVVDIQLSLAGLG